MKKISMLIISIVLISCQQSDKPSDKPSLIMSYTKKRGTPLEYEINVVWNKLTPGNIYLKFEPGSHPYPSGNWHLLGIDDQNKNYGQHTESFTFPDNNPSPTNFHFWAEFDPYAAGDNIQSGHKYESISFNHFRIIQLQMVNDNLWQYYFSGNNNYIGGQKRNEAFGDAGVIIKVISNRTGLSTTIGTDGMPINFSSTQNLFRWSVMTEYGVLMNGVDPKVSFLCGIDDIPASLVPNPPGEIITGYTVADPSHATPQISFILYSRIRNAYSSSTFDQVLISTGSSIHELGHAFGITGDGTNINPAHGGNNKLTCTMNLGFYPNDYNNCVFCDDHKEYFRTQNWFLEGQ